MERIELANALLVSSAAPAYVGPVPTRGMNGVKVDLLVISIGGSPTSVTAEVEMSNDGENWSTTGVSAAVSAFPGYGVDQTAGVGELCSQANVRIKLTVLTSGTACVKSGLLFFQFST